MSHNITRFDPERIADLSVKLIMAAGNNDVVEMERLRKNGADIDFKADVTFGTGAICFNARGFYEPKSPANALIAALHNGAFDAAMYLVKAGADLTFSRKSEIGNRDEKALDFLIMDQVRESVHNAHRSMPDFDSFLKDAFDATASAQRHKNYQTDLYTSQQRVQLFDAMVANMQAKALDPIGIVSKCTLLETVHWGRAEMIPKLAGIGVKIEDWHFVKAAHPIHREDKAIATMAAVLPYVKDVNVVDQSGFNAGHTAARQFDLPAFQWLEQRGLNKTAVAGREGEWGGNNMPTYAHAVAFTTGYGKSKSKDAKDFAQYLVDQHYPLNMANPHNLNMTPAETALRESRIEIGLTYINGGAEVKPEFLKSALWGQHYGNPPIPLLFQLIDKMEERGALTQEAMHMAFDVIATRMTWNSERNGPDVRPVLQKILDKGLDLNPENQQVAKRILAGESLTQPDEFDTPIRSTRQPSMRPPTKNL